MKLIKIIIWGLSIVFLLSACSTTSHQTKDEEKSLTISAAMSLADALDEMKPIFEEKYQVKLNLNLGSSGKLAQQIQNGAPTDVFISANQDWMDTLEIHDEIVAETREDVTGNRIVIIAPQSSRITLSSLDELVAQSSQGQIAVGKPETVPAGKYSYQVLENQGILDALASQFVIAKDVRQVLTYVETENAAIGFVYESDAKSSDKIKTLLTIDEQLHEAIVYPAAITAASKEKDLAADFIAFLLTDEAQAILAKHGFQK